MSETLEEVKKDFSDRFTQIYTQFGLSPTVCQIYTCLFFSSEPLGLKDIAEETGYSISTVNTTLDFMEKLMDIRKFKKPGSKKAYYECQHNIGIMQKKKLMQAKRIFPPITQAIMEAEDKLEKGRDKQDARVKKDLTELRNQFNKLESLLDKIEKLIREEMKKQP